MRPTRTLLALAIAALALATSTAGAAIQVANVQLSDRFLDHAEPGIAVNPRNPRNLLAVALLFNTAGPTPGTFWSGDGGHSWHDNGPLLLPRGASGGDNASVAFDTQGTGFVVAGSMTDNESQRGVYLWRTTNGGRSFSTPTAVAAGEFVDHPWLAIDSGPRSGGDDLYVAWVTRHGSNEGVAFSRSIDGGHTFTRQQIIARPAGGVTAPVATAGPGGAVYVAYFTVTQHRTAVMQVVSSTDHGQTFTPPRTVGPADFTVNPQRYLALPSGPMLATDSRTGAVYLTYATKGPSGSEDIVLARSNDHGDTWIHSTAVHGASLPHRAAAFQPEVAVNGDGTIAVFYLVLLNAHRAEAQLILAKTGGTAFAQPIRISTSTFDPTQSIPGNKEGQWWLGDYQALTAGATTFYPCWGDNRSGHMQIYSAQVTT
jgi:BNR repeat-like domain